MLDEAVEEKDGGEKVKLGMVVWFYFQTHRPCVPCLCANDAVIRSFGVTRWSCWRRWSVSVGTIDGDDATEISCNRAERDAADTRQVVN